MTTTTTTTTVEPTATHTADAALQTLALLTSNVGQALAAAHNPTAFITVAEHVAAKVESQADYAKRNDVSASKVTRFARVGRIILAHNYLMTDVHALARVFTASALNGQGQVFEDAALALTTDAEVTALAVAALAADSQAKAERKAEGERKAAEKRAGNTAGGSTPSDDDDTDAPAPIVRPLAERMGAALDALSALVREVGESTDRTTAKFAAARIRAMLADLDPAEPIEVEAPAKPKRSRKPAAA